MRNKFVALFGLVALVLGGVFIVSPKATTVANEAAFGIDIAADQDRHGSARRAVPGALAGHLSAHLASCLAFRSPHRRALGGLPPLGRHSRERPAVAAPGAPCRP